MKSEFRHAERPKDVLASSDGFAHAGPGEGCGHSTEGIGGGAMFKWFERCLGLSALDESEYDAIYGFPKKAVAEWLQWNPELEAQSQALENLAQNRRDKAADKQSIR